MQSVSIVDAAPNAAIWFTTDGTTPAPNAGTSQLHTSTTPVAINQTTTLKAIAAISGWTSSGVVTATYTLKAAVPTFSLPSGTYHGTQSVSIADSTTTAQIWYTTDGTTPSPNQGTSQQYTTGTLVVIAKTTTLKAIAAESGWTTSLVSSTTYTIH